MSADPVDQSSEQWVRSLALRTDLRVLELGGSEVEDRGTHLVVRTPDNPGYWWGSFLLLREPPVPGGEREVVGAFHTELPDIDHVAIALDGTTLPGPEVLEPFVDAGLTVEADVLLCASELPQEPPDLPQAVVVRPLDSDEDWEQLVDLDVVVMADQPAGPTRLFASRRAATERRMIAAGHGQRFGAFVDGRLASTAAAYLADPRTARYQSVATHPDHRRSGLASAVVHAAGTVGLRDLGADELVIVADPEGPAVALYRRLGFTDTEHSVRLQRPGT